MAQAVSDEAIVRATGRSWTAWLDYFEEIGAASLSHADIARRIAEHGGVSGWWSQMLTVVYEQHIGRRVPGQDCDGEFSVAVSKTVPGGLDDALRWWRSAVDGRGAFADIVVTRGPDVSQTGKWRYWRAGLADGSRVNVNIYEKAPGKSSLGIQHERLESADQAEHWRTYWKQFLSDAATPS